MLATLPINSAGELNDITILHFRGDYFLHVLMFVPWLLFFPAIKINLWLWFLCGILFASFSEAIQYLLPYRAFNVNDLLANIIGIFIGSVVVIAFKLTKILRE